MLYTQDQNVSLDKSASDRRLSQMQYLCHSLDLFASSDPVMRISANHNIERLRQEGYETDEIINLAATALLVAIEREVNENAAVCVEASDFSKPRGAL